MSPNDPSLRPAVLIVDDVPANLVALEAMLRRGEDVEVIRASSGEAALEILLERDVALAILDVQMPRMDGFELATLMQGVERTRDVPIVFVTASSRDEARVFEGYRAGAVDYLFKPIDERLLLGKVRVFVNLDRKRRQLLEAERMREMFIAVLGHDLRNPISGILMSANLLQRELCDADQLEILAGLVTSSHRMSRMIEQLLDATRFRSGGGIAISPRAGDLRALAEEIRAELGRDEVVVETRGDTSGTWDTDRLLQVLSNLVGNAVTHSPPRTAVQVTVDGHAADAVEVTVHNGGAPIPAELRPVLFEPFRRADQRRRGKEGLGLGLFIVREIVVAHGGTLTFESTEEAGTSFTATLPRHAVARSPEARPSRPPAGGSPAELPSHRVSSGDGTATERKTILLVEDEASARRALGLLLEERGYRVLLASRPSEALALASERRDGVDLLLTDLRLPESTGEALASEIQRIQPAARVVYMSGMPEPPEANALFIQKPIDLDALYDVVEQALSR